ncbi:WD40-repeat-containing domain protein, partial [Thamnocephalis sphaerospora]
LYTGSKDGSIVKWDLSLSKKVKVFPGGRKGTSGFPGHTDHVLALAVSSDGRYMASGGRDRAIHIWSVQDDKLLTTFRQHKDGISGLVFRKGSNQLYSASLDRSVKVWNIDQLSYIETLFGHQDVINAIDALAKEHCMTAGARDRTIRLWKIVEETQLVFRGGGSGVKKSAQTETNAETAAVPEDPVLEGSVDCVAMVNEEYFVTGGDSGMIALWHTGRKRPVFSQPMAHGLDEESGSKQPRWITAVTALRYSDLFATGSWDGVVRLWQISADMRQFSLVGTIAMPGFVNSLQFVEPQSNALASSAGILLVAGLGQEHRFGRWLRLGKAKNAARVVQLTWRKGATVPQAAALRHGVKRRRRATHGSDSDEGVDIGDL